MQIHLEEFARLTALLSHEERVEALNHSHLCRCTKCHKTNLYLTLREHLAKWEEYRAGSREVRKTYDEFWEAVAYAKLDLMLQGV